MQVSKKARQWAPFLLAVALVFSVLPTMAFAADPTAKDPVPTQTVAVGGTTTFDADDIAEDEDANDTLTITVITTPPTSSVATAALNADTGVVTVTGVAVGDTNVEVTVSDGTNTVNVTVPIKVAATPTAIDIAAIGGVTAPVTGATPVTTITDSAQYTGAVSWNTNPSTFAAETVYTATITLTPKTGYTLAGVGANFFTVAGATATNAVDTGVITTVFPETEAASTPVITIGTQPQDTTVTEGEITETLTVAASVTEGATLSYKWYEDNDTTAGGGTEITGETTNTFTIPTDLTSGDSPKYYYVVVSATGGAVDKTSTMATVTIEEAAVALTFTDADKYDVPAGVISSAINSISVADGVNGGTSPYTYSLEAGAPSWLDIDEGTGAITGTRPSSAAAAATATVKVTDSASSPASETITIAVGEVTATDETLAFTDDAKYDVPAGEVSTAIIEINVVDGVSGGTSPYIYSLEDEPSWLSIDSGTGVITGTRPASEAAATTATVKVTDSASSPASETITIAVGEVTEAAKTLSSIAVTTPPTKTVYTAGETFSKTGMVVTATYSDGSTAAVTAYTVDPDDALATTDATVTVSYTEGGVTKTATQAITVNAASSTTNHTVTFNSNGGTSVSSQTVVDGGKVTRPTNPTRAYYSFAGWYKNAALTTVWNFSSDVVTTNVTLYAKWNYVGSSSNDSGSGSGSGGGGYTSSDDNNNSYSGGSSRSRTTTSATPSTPVNVTTATANSAVNSAIAAARASGAGTAAAKLTNPGDISLSTLQSMARQAGSTTLKVNADSMNGKAVDVRITLNPANATTALDLSASTVSATARSVDATFEKFFRNNTMTVALGQQGSFGMSVEIAAKLDLTLDTDNLMFYIYNRETNSYTKIAAPAHWIDANSYVHFSTAVGGIIIISDGELTK